MYNDQYGIRMKTTRVFETHTSPTDRRVMMIVLVHRFPLVTRVHGGDGIPSSDSAAHIASLDNTAMSMLSARSHCSDAFLLLPRAVSTGYLLAFAASFAVNAAERSRPTRFAKLRL